MQLHDTKSAIKASKKISGKVPVPLQRFHNALFFLETWQRKLKLAQTKVKKYRKIVARYEKIYDVARGVKGQPKGRSYDLKTYDDQGGNGGRSEENVDG